MQVILILLSQCIFAFSKQELDSLYKIVQFSDNDSLRVSTLNKLIFNYIFSDISKAKTLILQSEKLAITKHLDYGYNELLYMRAVYYDVSGKEDSAKIYFTKSLNFSKDHQFKVLEIRSFNGLGMQCINSGKFNMALQYFFKALQLNDRLSHDKQLNPAIFYSNIGFAYQELDVFDKALVYNKKAYEIRKTSNSNIDLPKSLNNMGICYKNLGDKHSALKCFDEGLSIAKKIDDNTDFAKLTDNKGTLFIETGYYRKAINCYLDALIIAKEINIDPKYEFIFLSHLTNAYNKINQPEIALKYGQRGLEIYKHHPDFLPFAEDLFKSIAECYYLMGNIVKGSYYNNMYYNNVKIDFNNRNAKAIAEMEIKYKTQKKEIELLEANHKLKDQRSFNIYIISIGIVLILVLILMYLYNSIRTKLLIAKQENRVAEMIVAAEQNERQRIACDLHDSVNQKLAVMQMHLSTKKSKQIQELQIVEQLLQSTITEVRSISHNLFPVYLKDGLLSALNRLCEQNNFANKLMKFELSYDSKFEKAKISQNIELIVYRIVQEISNNALKYSNANRVFIRLNIVNSKISLHISDNGVGFQMHPDKEIEGIGLKNIVERISKINGKLEIVSNPLHGTEFKIEIPI